MDECQDSLQWNVSLSWCFVLVTTQIVLKLENYKNTHANTSFKIFKWKNINDGNKKT